jgi:hypothetical protein
MTVYAEANANAFQIVDPVITKTFNVMVWVEMDRVRMSQQFYTVSITGQQSDMPSALSYEIDGKQADMADVADLLAWAKQGGSVEKVAEEVAA